MTSKIPQYLKYISIVLALLNLIPPVFGDINRVLLIGNSYTNQVKPKLLALVKAHRPQVKLNFVTPGGYKLEQHLEQQSLHRLINGTDWDLVILQEQSQYPAYSNLRNRFFQAVKRFADIADQRNFKLALFMTWGRRDGDRQNIGISPDFTTMQLRLTQGYNQIGRQVNAFVIPVGQAWGKIYNKDQSEAKKLYQQDGSHPSAQGAILSAMVIYQAIWKNVPLKNIFSRQVSERDYNKYREIAKLVLKGKSIGAR